MKFLSESGLTYFLNKLKGLFLTITDFNKVYDNGVIDAKQIVHKTNSDSSTNYDLVLGNKTDDESDSYIKIDSTRSVNGTGKNKNGNIYINATSSIDSPSVNVNAGGNVNVDSESNVNINSSDGTNIGSGDNINISAKNNLDIEVTNGSVDCFCSNFRINYTGKNNFNLRYNRDGLMGLYYKGDNKFIYAETKDYNSESDKVQFLTYTTNGVTTTALDIRPTQIKCWTDAFSIKKDKEIKFKTSSTNSCRLTEGEGFKVFGNLYAMPDNATDISEYTEEEQQLLADNTVQKLILKLNSSKASAKTMKKIAKQTIQQPKVCVRKAININSVYDNVIYYHKGVPSIKLKPGNYRIFVDNNPIHLDSTYNNGKNITSLGNNIYKVDNSINEKWNNLYYIATPAGAYYRKVVEVYSIIENNVKFTEVKIDTLFDSYLNGIVKTTSPYFSIVLNEIVSNISIKVTDVCFNCFNYYNKYSDYKILIGILKHDVIKSYDTVKKEFKYVGHRHKYRIVNKKQVNIKNSRRFNGHRGTGILKYYRKGIVISERNVSIYDGSIN